MNKQAQRSVGYTLKWIGIGLFIACQVTKSWLVVPRGFIEVGMYQICDGTGCSYIPWNTLEYLSPFVTRFVFIIVTCLVIVSIFMHIGTICCMKQKKNTSLKVEGSLDIAAGLIVWIAMTSFTITTFISTQYLELFLNSGWFFGWSYYLSWVVGIFFIAAGLMELFAGNDVEQARSLNPSPYQHPDQTITAVTSDNYIRSILSPTASKTESQLPYHIPRPKYTI